MFNRVILVGRLTADPELKQTPNGVSVTSFSIAVDRAYKGKGEKQTDFIEIVAWRQTAEFICQYFSKGRALLVEGTLQTRSYTDKNDQKRRVWEVVADNVRFVESKGSAGGNTPAAQPADTHDPADDFVEIDDDGDLPF